MHQRNLIILLWSVLTLLNLDKAYHIDDAFHLEFAHLLIENPANPMSGSINWENDPVPLKLSNHPPLFFYMIAAVIYIFGDSEIILHLFLSLFTLGCLIYFNKLLIFFRSKNPHYLLILFGFNPAFLVNQNLMLDVPILAFILSSVYFLFKGIKTQHLSLIGLSFVLLTIGFFMKYSVLPLFPAFGLILILNRQWKYLLFFIIPAIFILLWSLWNYYEVETIHLMGRSANRLLWHKPFGFIICIGGLMFMWLYFINDNNKLFKVYKWFNFLTLFTLLVAALLKFISQQWINYVMLVIFLINGIYIMYFSANLLSRKFKQEKLEYLKTNHFAIAVIIISIAVFITTFTAFIASRHILLISPFVLLFLDNSKILQFRKKQLALISTMLFGIALGLSDWYYADFYRKNAQQIDIKNKMVWSLGHWGWQWYSRENGMNIYATNESKVEEGDIFVYPLDVPRQEINSNVHLETLHKITEKPALITIFSGKDFGSMYSSSLIQPPWTFSTQTIDTIMVQQVMSTSNISEN